MKIICNPAGVIDILRPTQGIMDIAASAFADILLDLSMFCSPGELENLGRDKKKGNRFQKSVHKESIRPLISEHPLELYNYTAPLLEQCSSASLHIPIARAPYLPRNTKWEEAEEFDDLLSQLTLLIQEGIRLCGRAGCPYLIVKPLPWGSREAEWKSNQAFYHALIQTAGENHVTLLLENQCRDFNGHLIHGTCSSAAQSALWIDRLNEDAGEELFGFCMDTGTCTLCGQNMQEFVSALGSRLKAVILRDCDGHRETSMLPFTYSGFERSGTDWLGLIRGLREIHFDGQLILDFATTAAAFSPLLRPQLMQLAKGMGEYFKWQIGIENVLKNHGSIVLFGAGNMCRNYMKCYGDKYPPLFTCDNNPKLWGTLFCGLEVKPPESLKKLPEDCAIVICNIYYRQIQKQLQDMGVSNEIEFFSDEFMPSFYFDRLERGE